MNNKPQTRLPELLAKAADTFDECSDPFYEDWLMENDVSASDCMALSRNIAWIIKGFLSMPWDVKNEIMVRGCAAGELPEEAIEAMVTANKMKAFEEKLGRVM